MDRSRIVPLAALSAVIAVYIAARFWRLTESCLWFDEIFSVHAADHAWNRLFSFVALDLIHPPLFYFLLKLWIAIGGEIVFWLRLLPVALSCIAVVPFLLLCRELKLKASVTTLALLLLAVNGSLIKYAQEVRMYSLLMCLSLFSMWLFARYLARGQNFIALLIVNVLLVYAHYFGWFVVSAEVAAIFILQRAKWRQVVAMFVLVFASFLPWLIAVWRAMGAGSSLGQNIAWIPKPALSELSTFVFDLIEPFYHQASSADPASAYRVSVPILLMILTAIALYIAAWNQRNNDERRAVYFLSIFAGMPPVAAFVASWLLPHSIWGTRHLIIVAAPISLLFATAFTFSRWHRLKVGLVTMVLLFTGYSFGLQATRSTLDYSWCGFEMLAGRIESDGRGPVYVFEDLAAYHLWFAFRTNPDEKTRGRVIKVDAFPGMLEDKAFFIPRGLNDDYMRRENLSYNGGHFWVVYRAPGFDLGKPPLDTLRANGYNILRQESYDGDDRDVFAIFVENIERK